MYSKARWILAGVCAHWVFEAVLLGALFVTVPHKPHTEPVVDTIVVSEPPSRLVELTERMGGNEEIASAILLESDRSGVPVDLIVGIIRVENPWLLPDTTNHYGATGLMQVVGWLHLGDHPECGEDLTNIRTNICYGVRIFERKLERARGDTMTALLYYNGCAGSTYIRGCERYAPMVVERGEMR